MALKWFVSRINENKTINLGTVKELKEGTGSSEGKVVTLVMEALAWNKAEQVEEVKTFNVEFWNTDTVKLADLVKAAKVHEGSVLTLEVYEKNGKLYGNGFKYKGHWQIPATEDTKEKNIFMGVVASIKTAETATGKTYTRISMPVDATKAGEEPEWVTITFWNNEKVNLADNAGKVLAIRDEKKAKAVIVCGETDEYNGRHQYNAFEFIVLPEK